METNFDKVINHVRIITDRASLAIVFINGEGQPSASGQVKTIFNKLAHQIEGWRKIVGVYDSNHEDWMIDEDLTFLGYRLK